MRVSRALDSIFVRQSGDVIQFPSDRVRGTQPADGDVDPHAMGRQLLKSKGWVESKDPELMTTEYRKTDPKGRVHAITTGPYPDFVSYIKDAEGHGYESSGHGSILDAYRKAKQYF